MASICFLGTILFLIYSCVHAQSPGSVALMPHERGSAAMGCGPFGLHQFSYDQFSFNLSLPDNYEKASGAFSAGIKLEYFTTANRNQPYNVSIAISTWLNGRQVDSYNTFVPEEYIYLSACVFVAPGDSYSVVVHADGSLYQFYVSSWFNWIAYDTAANYRCKKMA